MIDIISGGHFHIEICLKGQSRRIRTIGSDSVIDHFMNGIIVGNHEAFEAQFIPQDCLEKPFVS